MPAGRMISWSVLASIRVSGSSTKGLGPVRSRRVACAARGGDSGRAARGPIGMRPGLGPFRPWRECNKARDGGSNPPPCTLCSRPGRADRRSAGDAAPILPTCDPTTHLGCLFEIVETLVLTLIIFFVIQNFVAQPYKVQQQSMEHTLEPDQYVLVDKLTPRFDTYKRGDIVVFTPPADWVQDDGTPFIKRVIGDRRRHRRDPRRPRLHQRHRARRAVPLRRARRAEPQPTTVPGDDIAGSVPAGELFLMGDHRAELGRFADLRPRADRPGHRPRLAALLAAQHVRHPPDADLPGTGPPPMSRRREPGPRGGRAGGRRRSRGRRVRPERAGRDPRPGRRDGRRPAAGRPVALPLALAARLVAAVLAGYLLWIAVRGPRAVRTGGSLGRLADRRVPGHRGRGRRLRQPRPRRAGARARRWPPRPGSRWRPWRSCRWSPGATSCAIGLGLVPPARRRPARADGLGGTPDQLEQLLTAGLVASPRRGGRDPGRSPPDRTAAPAFELSATTRRRPATRRRPPDAQRRPADARPGRTR